MTEWLCKGGPDQGAKQDQRTRRRNRSLRLLATLRASVQFAMLLICLVAAGASDSAPMKIDVRNEDLLVQPPTANWISYNGDYSGRRYSGLS